MVGKPVTVTPAAVDVSMIDDTGPRPPAPHEYIGAGESVYVPDITEPPHGVTGGWSNRIIASLHTSPVHGSLSEQSAAVPAAQRPPMQRSTPSQKRRLLQSLSLPHVPGAAHPVLMHTCPIVQRVSSLTFWQLPSAPQRSRVQATMSSQSALLLHIVPDAQPRSRKQRWPAAHRAFTAVCSQRPPNTHSSSVHAMRSSHCADDVHCPAGASTTLTSAGGGGGGGGPPPGPLKGSARFGSPQAPKITTTGKMSPRP